MSKVSKVSMDMPCHQLKVLHVGRPCRVTCVRTIEIRLVHSCFFRLSPHPHWNDLSQSNWLDLGTIRFQKDRFHLNFALDSGQQWQQAWISKRIIAWGWLPAPVVTHTWLDDLYDFALSMQDVGRSSSVWVQLVLLSCALAISTCLLTRKTYVYT